MISSIKQTLSEFIKIIDSLPAGSYNTPCLQLSGASIGAHTRHIIELYQCLLEGYEQGEVSYDKRKRNKLIESDAMYAIQCIEMILNDLEKTDKDIEVEYELHNTMVRLKSNYSRELMYNLEHTIHHQALIRVAIESQTSIELPIEFGVAPSTIEYRKVCAQ
jgi:uncharacterized damage-inducible protein DinB